jgi:hypothetical protein
MCNTTKRQNNLAVGALATDAQFVDQYTVAIDVDFL